MMNFTANREDEDDNLNESSQYIDPSSSYGDSGNYVEEQSSSKETNDNQGEQDDDDDDVQIYRTRTRDIKSVRVELEYSHQSPTNEQAPKQQSESSLRRSSDDDDDDDILSPIPIKRNSNANTAIKELSSDRFRSSINKQLPSYSIHHQNNMDGNNKNNNNNTVKNNKAPKNLKSSYSIRNKKLLEESNLTDEEGDDAVPNQCNFLLATMLSGISYYYIFSFLLILGWTSACTWYIQELKKRGEEENDEKIKDWITWFDETDIRMIGSLFVFSLVFRFNQCYNRWWQGRMLWGDIIQNCLDFSRKSTLWIVDKAYSDRMNRYIICFPYAAKAQLRGLSLTDETESGQALVDRGFMTQEELDFLKENPCWEPDFFLDLMRAVVAKVILLQWELEPDHQMLLLPHSNRIHDRLFPPMDKAIYDLGNSIGEGVSVRSAGLPRSYDTVHYIFFWIYFLLAPPAEAATIGWLAPVMLGFSACIIMTLMDMGTAMVDPFGTDIVDLPIERFCETIEAQVMTIQRRHRTSAVMDFATHATPLKPFINEAKIKRRMTVMDLTS